MSERRETLLRLVQDETGRITDVKVEQQPVPAPKLLTVIELRPETKETYLNNLTEGSVVDWGDGERSVVSADEAAEEVVRHTYADTSTTNRVVTIDGVIDRTEESGVSAFDPYALVAIQSLGELRGEAKDLFLDCCLRTIPQGLFDHLTAVTDFSECFARCHGLRSIPEGLFANCTAVTDFSRCFQECSSLNSIPEGLFANCTAVTDFSYCFERCSDLTSVPEGLFANCTAVTDFSYCFSFCYKLTSIPEGLFTNCTAATNFFNCFGNCSSLTAIPAGVFDNCTAVTDFGHCFNSCSSLTGETPYTMVNGKKVKLWERSTENGFSKVTEHNYCFRLSTGLSDYEEIPDGWK